LREEKKERGVGGPVRDADLLSCRRPRMIKKGRREVEEIGEKKGRQHALCLKHSAIFFKQERKKKKEGDNV